jgi:hypothetical protein
MRFLIVALDGRGIGLTPIDGDRLRRAMAMDRLGEKAWGGCAVPLSGEEEGNGLARIVHPTWLANETLRQIPVMCMSGPASPKRNWATLPTSGVALVSVVHHPASPVSSVRAL